MGYFSNGIEGMDYGERFCSRCVHVDIAGGCPVWEAHLLYAYELCDKEEHPGKVILDMLIPPAKDGCGNAECAMFHPKGGPSKQTPPVARTSRRDFPWGDT